MINITLLNTPQDFAPVNKELWFRLDSASSSVSNFKYIFRLKERNEPFATTNFRTLSTYKVPPSPDGWALFSPHQPLKSFFKYYVNPFQIGFDSNFVQGFANSGIPDGLVEYKVDYGFEYNPNQPYYDIFYNSPTTSSLTFSSAHGLTAGDLLTIDKTNKQINPQYDGTCSVISVGGPDWVIIDKAPPTVLDPLGTDGGTIKGLYRIVNQTPSYYTYNGTRQYTEVNTNFENYILGGPSGSNSQFLYNYKGGKNIGYGPNEWETISMIIATPSGASSSIEVRLYDAQYNITGIYTSYLPDSSPYVNRYRRLDYGVGTANLAQEFNIDFTNPLYKYYYITYYEGATIKGQSVLYNVVKYCSPYDQKDWSRVCWVNRLGGFDYFTFNRDTKKSVNITRSGYQKILDWNYNIGDRGKTIFNVKADEVYTIQTNWITQDEAEWLEQLMTSPEVFIIKDNQKLPIEILQNTYEVKSTLRDRMFNFILNFRFAYGLNIQND